MTTEHQMVLSFTSSTQLSMVDHAQADQNWRSYVQPAQWYVSHAWGYEFLDVVDALDAFFSEKSTPVWFCLFMNNQHTIQQSPNKSTSFEELQHTFQMSLQAIGRIVMVFAPWNRPTTLARLWCVFEVYVAVVRGSIFDVAMSSAQRNAFFEATKQNPDWFYDMLTKIQSANAEASRVTDKINIRRVIAEQTSFEQVDRKIFDALDAWLLRTLEDKVTNTQDELTRMQTRLTLIQLSRAKNDTAATQNQLVQLEKELEAIENPEVRAATIRFKHFLDATTTENDFRKVVARQLVEARAAGDTTLVRALLKHKADDLIERGDLGQAEYALKECLTLFDPNDPLARNITFTLGGLLMRMKKFQQANAFLSQAYSELVEKCGDSHPETIKLLSLIAGLYKELGHLDKAELVLQHCWTTNRRTLGTNDTDTGMTAMALVKCQVDQAKFEAALATLDDFVGDSYDTLAVEYKIMCMNLLDLIALSIV
ncbi:hypothetical protein LEN26_014861 [Aphanomyces euteiches]|nr:hypothetical protein LEN26_014861 [Aphanomyces euteiches]KAH9105488.1 hypothetical protein AeMF1_018716 [Aphanomyces euteiches]KAH9182426.1 hypothetical protein AeNC1_015599 [Aphanomyces euteiches]